MTNLDPALEKWIDENEFDAYDSTRSKCLGSVVDVSDLRALLKGKRLVDAEPVTVKCAATPCQCGHSHPVTHEATYESGSKALISGKCAMIHMLAGVKVEPLYAAPRDTGVGNG